MSRCLSERSIDHVVLERGEVADTWRRRWDSLRLLTPNWLSRLPGYRYDGDDPDGFMTMPEVVSYIRGYAAAIDAPVVTGAEVTVVEPGPDRGYRVATADSEWHARAVVVASGHYHRPDLPAVAGAVPAGVESVTAAGYRRPEDLPEGGVL